MKCFLMCAVAMIVVAVSLPLSGAAVSLGESVSGYEGVVRHRERGRYRERVRRDGAVIHRERHRSRTVTGSDVGWCN